MKLLASLLGAAVADYACCPYDHYGVVYEGCPLTEKTPWAMDDNNHDRWGVEHHMCKAWEANVDATFEGTEDYDNWGGCGFQRHFPWYWGPAGVFMEGQPILNQGGANEEMHCRLGYFDCNNGPNYGTNYHGFMPVNHNKPNPIVHRLDTDTAAFTASGHAAVVGKVHLGAVCKLWIPVRRKFIDSVSVAGVHLFGGGSMEGGDVDETMDNGKASVFDETWVCADDDCNNPGNTPNNGDNIAMGTSYCFSVVNIGEFFENWHGRDDQLGKDGQFNVMNGNVAGRDEGGHDAIRLPGKEFEHDFEVNFGDPVDNFDALNPDPSNPVENPPGMGTIVEGGANFDVVVHFKSQWCMRHWKIVDMQQYDLIFAQGQGPERHPDWISVNNGHDDWGSMEHDYEIYKDYNDPRNPPHAHTDVMDKRIDATVGMGGCCLDLNANGLNDGTGPFVRYDDDSFWDFTDNWRPLPPTATGCAPCDRLQHGDNNVAHGYSSHNWDGADNINFYSQWFVDNNMHGEFHWPNAGAWAAFHSFITCADNQFMIYDLIQSVDANGMVLTMANRDTPKQTRDVVHSMFYNDIRHDYTNAAHGTGDICIRGNLRQVGTKVVYCGPGVINTMAHRQSIAVDADGDHVGGPNDGATNDWLNSVDFRRCTWNWNFHEGFEHIQLLNQDFTNNAEKFIHRDPEHFFERNNPTYQRVWGMGEAILRGHDWHDADENNGAGDGNPDLPHLPGWSNGHDIYVRPVVETVTFTISFQTDKDHGPDYLIATDVHNQIGVVDGNGEVQDGLTAGDNNPRNLDPYGGAGMGNPDVHPNQYQFFLDAPKYFTPQEEIEIRVKANTNHLSTDQAHQVTFTMWCLESSLDGNGPQMPIGANRRDGYGHEVDPEAPNAPDYATGFADINDFKDDFDDDVQYRDRFPDCFMGDEIHFEYVIKNGENQFVGDQSNNQHHRISAWYSYVDVSFQSSEATNPASPADIDTHNPLGK